MAAVAANSHPQDMKSLLSLLLFCTACMGSIGESGSGPDDLPIPGGGDPVIPEIPVDAITEPARGISTRIRRLSPIEYDHAVRDIFDGRIVPSGRFDVQNLELGQSGYSTDPLANQTTADALLQLHESAEAAAEASLEVMDALLPCASAGESCVDTYVDRYAAAAFRRPLSTDELAGLRERLDGLLGRRRTQERERGSDPELAFRLLPFVRVEGPAIV